MSSIVVVFVFLITHACSLAPPDQYLHNTLLIFSERMGADSKTNYRNLISFWIFGICCNFSYIVMITGAQDILDKHVRNVTAVKSVEHCEPEVSDRHCSRHSASLVLLCNILPGFIAKLLYPFTTKWIPYGVRHLIVCILQAASLVIVALADSVPVALVGVMVGSVQSGLGESTYLGLASHYPKNTISTWSSGTGMAGLLGAFSYAGMTDSRLLGLSSSEAMLLTLVVPFVFCITYYLLLERADTIRQAKVTKPITWIGLDKFKERKEAESDGVDTKTRRLSKLSWKEKLHIAKGLQKYMIPLFTVYFAEYLINQGLVELIVFDCVHGFGTSIRAQYRWYQCLYQVGVFISRSSVNLFQLNMTWLCVLPILQLINAVFFLFDSIYYFVPFFGIVAVVVLYEGLIGGASYVNSYNHIHKKIDPSIREFALSIVTLADTAGILVAALAAMPIHNAICTLPL